MEFVAFLLFLPALYYLWFFLMYNAAGSALLSVVIIIAAMIPFFLGSSKKTHHVWFKTHRIGYGWSPIRWEGWAIVLMMVLMAIFVGYIVDLHAHSVSDTLIAAFPFWFLIFTTLLAIASSHSEKNK